MDRQSYKTDSIANFFPGEISSEKFSNQSQNFIFFDEIMTSEIQLTDN